MFIREPFMFDTSLNYRCKENCLDRHVITYIYLFDALIMKRSCDCFNPIAETMLMRFCHLAFQKLCLYTTYAQSTIQPNNINTHWLLKRGVLFAGRITGHSSWLPRYSARINHLNYTQILHGEIF